MRIGVVLSVGLVVLVVATAGMLGGVEPFASWYYHFGWLGVLLVGDALAAWKGGSGRLFLLDHPARTASMAFWSAMLWLFFEAINLRIQNWYYVFLPRDPALRWAGEAVAFATVLPAVFVAFSVISGAGLARRVRWRPLYVDERLLRALPLIGVAMFALPLIWPRYFFPLVWVALAPILEPYVYRRAPDRSLLADLQRGQPQRLLCLLAGGAAIGLIWELLNYGARTKWIYTVPGFVEAPRLFEMPVLGFFGFPPFAVECFIAWQALVIAGFAVDGARAPARTSRVAAYVAAAIGAFLVLVAMDGPTVDSLRPTLGRLYAIAPADASNLHATGFDIFRLADAEPRELADAIGAGATGARGKMLEDQAAAWIRAARIATFRGIGTEHAARLAELGIASIEQLAEADADELAQRLRADGGPRVPIPRVRIWVASARRARP